jgi:quercetin dioxygenase-like cupin family protein
MTDVRPFGTENSHPIPHEGVARVSASVIQLPAAVAARFTHEQLAERYQGVPLAVDTPVSTVALLFDPHGHIHEHAAPYPILFVVIGGEGYVRVGGEQAEAMKVHAGYAVLWPADVLHKAWTTDTAMQAIAVEFGN